MPDKSILVRPGLAIRIESATVALTAYKYIRRPNVVILEFFLVRRIIPCPTPPTMRYDQ